MYRIIVICFVTLLISCDADENVKRIQLLEETGVTEENKVIVEDGKNKFQLVLQEVEDSRCPSNANCVSAGKVTVKFLLEQEELLMLCLGECDAGAFVSADSVAFNVKSKPYYIKLTEVKPYPMLPDDKVKTAVISVFK